MFRIFFIIFILGNSLFSQTNNIRFNDIKKWVEENNVNTIEELLPYFPKDMRKNYVLMEKSRSLHQASREFPRVLMHDKRAEIVVSFNGDPNHRGYSKLEVIEYEPQNYRYNFYSIHFPHDEGQIGPPHIEVNPGVCNRCHRTPARPNWEPYPFWPGAIGSSNQMTEEDFKYLKNFVSEGKKNKRYQHLLKKENLKEIEDDILEKTPAFKLHVGFSAFQTKRNFANRLTKVPQWNTIKYTVVAALSECGPVFEYIPTDFHLGEPAIWDSIFEHNQYLFAKAHYQHYGLIDENHFDVYANLRYVMEGLGHDMKHWGTSFLHPYLYAGTAGLFFKEVIGQLKQQDADIKMLNPDVILIQRHLNRTGIVGEALYSDSMKEEFKAYCRQLKRLIP